MFGKNIFKNEDGTLKPINITLFVCLIVALIMAFFLKDTNVFKPNLNRTTTTNPISTTTIALCKDCSFEFSKKSIEIEAGTEVPLEDIMDYQNIELNKITFKSDDTSIVKIASHEGKLYLASQEEVGSTKITAEFEDMSSTLEVSVIATTIKEAHLTDTIYFAYRGKKNKIDIDVTPKGADYKLLKLSTENPDIAEFNEKGELVGKEIGETKIFLNTNQKVSSDAEETNENVEERLCYVIDNMITIKIKEGSTYKEQSEYLYRGTYTGEVSVALSIEDNENVGYTGDSIEWEVISQGSMNGEVSFQGLAQNNVDYIYIVKVTFNQEEAMDENKITVYFKLPDGSKNRLIINKQ